MYKQISTIGLCGLAAFVSLRADLVTLKNGDRISGLIIESDREAMTMKTEFLGEVKIQWEPIERIQAEQTLFVTDQDGQVLVGPVSTEGARLQVRTKTGAMWVAKATVQTIHNSEKHASYEAEIERLRNPSLLNFWSGYLDTGFNFTGGNSDTRNLTISAKTERKTRRDKITVHATSILAQQRTSGPRETTANAIRGGSRYELNLSEKLFTFGFIDLEFDEFQNLDLRNILGGGLGWHLKNTQHLALDFFSGGAFNQEFFSDDITRRSGELVMGQELSHRLTERFSWANRFTFYPNLSQSGEYRLQFDLSLVSQLYRWFDWQITLVDRFLSNPIPGTQKNDILVTTGFRLNFKPEDIQ